MYIKQPINWRIKYHFLMVNVYQATNQLKNQISLLNGQCISSNQSTEESNITSLWSMYIKQPINWRIKYHFLMVNVYQATNQLKNQISLLNGQCISSNQSTEESNITSQWSMYIKQPINWRIKYHFSMVNVYQATNQLKNQISLLNGQCISSNQSTEESNITSQWPMYIKQSINWRIKYHFFMVNVYQSITTL